MYILPKHLLSNYKSINAKDNVSLGLIYIYIYIPDNGIFVGRQRTTPHRKVFDHFWLEPTYIS